MPENEPTKTCKDCRYWLFGSCHYGPPVNIREDGKAVWPETKPDDSCGRWATAVYYHAPIISDEEVIGNVRDATKGDPAARPAPWTNVPVVCTLSELITDLVTIKRVSHSAAKQKVASMRRRGLLTVRPCPYPEYQANEFPQGLCVWESARLPEELKGAAGKAVDGRTLAALKLTWDLPALRELLAPVCPDRPHADSIRGLWMKTRDRHEFSLSTFHRMIRAMVDEGLLVQDRTGIYLNPLRDSDPPTTELEVT